MRLKVVLPFCQLQLHSKLRSIFFLAAKRSDVPLSYFNNQSKQAAAGSLKLTLAPHSVLLRWCWSFKPLWCDLMFSGLENKSFVCVVLWRLRSQQTEDTCRNLSPACKYVIKTHLKCKLGFVIGSGVCIFMHLNTHQHQNSFSSYIKGRSIFFPSLCQIAAVEMQLLSPGEWKAETAVRFPH